jgi:hypothetical protein
MILDAWQPATTKKAEMFGAHCNADENALVLIAVTTCLPKEPMHNMQRA